jgi:hypothetical protein
MQNALVRYSRAGDAFHYRWAARRCLRMIDPTSGLRSITVEASKDQQAPGEYAIDLAEYFETANSAQRVAYYQLKHSTVRAKTAFTFSELKDTFKNFSKRFRAEETQPKKGGGSRAATFSIVTNRKISDSLKDAICKIGSGGKAPANLQTALEQATTLNGSSLRRFCSVLTLTDGEGDYIVQKRKLRGEIAEYVAGFIDSDDTAKIIELVADRALPQAENGKRNGEITPEDLLQRLGVTSPRDLFPASPAFEPLVNSIRREQHDAILQHVLGHSTPAIVHAEGGVGKSVVARMIAASLPSGSHAVLYDCFGSGKYRSPSEPRHHARHALVQMANELASRGLCRPLLPRPGLSQEDYFRAFIERLREATKELQAIKPAALLVLLIDAADNAEMAAAEFGDLCFASALLRDSLPPNCRLAMFCRTERVDLLKAADSARRFLLLPFSEQESRVHLRRRFADASEHDGREFHRLSGGNPRVQANALAAGHPTVEATLAALGPGVTTVNDQIADQLRAAIAKARDQHAPNFGQQVDALCYGLANLPPLIPIPVLAKAADVSAATVKSFVSDLGRPLWYSDDAVQFRDEPTETWFRQQFAADAAQIASYVSVLEPLAAQYTYVAKALPQLLLQSGNHTRLIALALSDTHLPTNNPIDERDVRVYRLQFAFKAALKQGGFADAARLAFRAGEEVAGDQRQTELLGKNTDLIALLQGHRIQELAYRRVLSGGWEGCENIYSAALLSSVTDFKGEARAYLRAAHRWLEIYFKERTKIKDQHNFHDEPLTDAHILELAWAHYNLSGAQGLVHHLAAWKPGEVVFRVMRIFSRRLIDAGRFAEIDALARAGAKTPYFILAIADELGAVARLPRKDCLRPTLTFLTNPTKRPKKPQGFQLEEFFTPALVSFLEACAGRGLPRKTIARVLNHYTESTASSVLGSDYQAAGRGLFLRGIALRAVLARNPEPNVDSLLPMPKKGESAGSSDSDRTNLHQMLGALLPWHFLRTNLLVRSRRARSVDLESVKASSKSAAASRYRSFDRIPFEVSALRFEVLAWKSNATAAELDDFLRNVLNRADPTFWLPDRLRAARVAFRSAHLARLRDTLEQSCSQDLQQPGTDGPEERADRYVRLGRAVLSEKRADASAYLSDAVDAVSKFGDEMVERWEAVVTMAKRSAESPPVPQPLVYRFVRCAEMIGDTVAREKYWNRDDVFRVAARLDHTAAFAALSRWRDRDVGSFGDQLEALATVSVDDNQLTPSAAWCLSGFHGCNGSAEFAALCLKRETNPGARRELLARAIRDLELAGADRGDWKKLRVVAHELGLATDRLDNLVAAAPERDYGSTALPGNSRAKTSARRDERRARSFFKGIDLLHPEGLNQAVTAFRTSEPPRDFEMFWRELFKRVPAGKESEFLEVLAREDTMDYFDMGYALAYIRTAWLEKAAVKRAWPQFTFAIGRRYAAVLSNSFRINYWRQHVGLKEEDILLVRRGIVEGLSDSLELVDASTFFGFVINVATDLTPEEARGLLDYSLERFERHMDPESGDGPWADWLAVRADTPQAMAGLLWSALASPYAETRWQAAHCVRRLAELGCDREIDALLDWMDRGVVGAFGSHRLPFYALHAKLYFLIALARTAVEQPAKLARNGAVFAHIALSGMPHLLIQKYAAEISLAIERACPGTFSLDMKTRLQQVGRSPMAVREIKNESVWFDTPWHAKGAVDTSLKYHFGMDFGDYWLQPLGKVFGVSQVQVEALVRAVAVKELGALSSDDYEPDPRQAQWNSHGRESYYYRSSYSRADNHRFYVSYHAMLSVAARLHAHMPVLRRGDDDWVEDRWNDWRERHTLTRSDGRWLSDRRDPMPVIRRAWTKGTPEGHCLWSVAPDDFFDVLRRQSAFPDALSIAGNWSDCVNDRVETVRISSALVDRQTAESLATSLRSGHGDYYLPGYKSREEDFGPPPFDLAGWIQWPESDSSRLDSFDPYAKSIPYPPLEIGESFASLLGVSTDVERREWRTLADGTLIALCDIWSNRHEESHRRASPYRSGRRMTASIGLLRQLCAGAKKDLIITVAIDRHLDTSYGSRETDLGYTPPSHQIFLFSANGRLRDAKKSY